MTTMWIDPQQPFEIQFLNGLHGQSWKLSKPAQEPQLPTPPKIPFVLLEDLELS